MSATSTAASAAVLASHGMPARLRQEEEAAERDPAAGPVEEQGESGQSPGRVGAVGASRELTPSEQEQVKRLKKRDAEVRQHEQAHLMAAGPYAQGPPQYEYQTGPDGKRYAIGGSVKIDTRPIPDDPQATIQKAQVVRRAALAPKDLSPADRRIARDAGRMEMKARQEMELQQRERMRAQVQAAPDGTEPGQATSASANLPEVAPTRKQPFIFIPTSGMPYALASDVRAGQGHPRGEAGAPTAYNGNGAREALYGAFPARLVDRYA